ncbi:hypothetical protein BC833DRAFT_613448 [Globomyces pollinis-pini]|nr:hypothetical protein BC833DRAFT_613448 [Globomyces pollinis-pini]KAJ2988424.1 hypothetical protein HDV02_005597 [Globomyces sp. JEL0801]
MEILLLMFLTLTALATSARECSDYCRAKAVQLSDVADLERIRQKCLSKTNQPSRYRCCTQMCADRLFASADWATSAAQLLEGAGGVVPVLKPVVEAVSEREMFGGKAKRNNPLWLPAEDNFPLQVGTTMASIRVGNWLVQVGVGQLLYGSGIGGGIPRPHRFQRPIEQAAEIAYRSIEAATTGDLTYRGNDGAFWYLWTTLRLDNGQSFATAGRDVEIASLAAMAARYLIAAFFNDTRDIHGFAGVITVVSSDASIRAVYYIMSEITRAN